MRIVDSERTRVKVQIYGEEYTLKGRANPEYIREIARYVDGIMMEIKERNPKLASTQVAVLAAVNIADLYFTSRWNDKAEDVKEGTAGKAGEV
ncbi:MAG: cell division protein ZapA [Firmicutes bacterium]|nr:cell division protein ZapA [Bacillota bacterium]